MVYSSVVTSFQVQECNRLIKYPFYSETRLLMILQNYPSPRLSPHFKHPEAKLKNTKCHTLPPPPTGCIRLSDPTPFKHRARPIHPSDYQTVRPERACDANIIRESDSPFLSLIVIVKKKSGAIRLYIDYRKLNNQTIKDAYPFPNIKQLRQARSGSLSCT